MSPVGAIAGSDAPARSATNQFSEMSSEDFIKIIFTELSNQDPFEPTDSASLLQQLSSIRSIESDMRLTQQLDSLVRENQLASAGNLVGKFVGGLSENNDRVAGWVLAIHREGNKVYLELDSGWMLPASNIETIFDPGIFDDETPDSIPDPPSGGADPGPGDPPGDDDEND